MYVRVCMRICTYMFSLHVFQDESIEEEKLFFLPFYIYARVSLCVFVSAVTSCKTLPLEWRKMAYFRNCTF